MLAKIAAVTVAAIATLGLTATTAQAANAPAGAVTVTQGQYQALTQQPAACATSDQDGYHAPAAPASVQRAANSRALPSRYWRHYPGASTGAVTANGLPTHWYKNVNVVTSYLTVDGHRQQVTYRPILFRAWVPGYAGASCSTWTLIQYVD